MIIGLLKAETEIRDRLGALNKQKMPIINRNFVIDRDQDRENVIDGYRAVMKRINKASRDGGAI